MTPRLLIAVIGLAVTLGYAQAQTILGAEPNTYPNRAIRIIVPFPPGGPADMIARLVGQRMSEDWGQPVLIENRAGGNTAIGAQAAARSPPGGYTLFAAAMDTTMVLNPLVTPNLPYDPLNDFIPVAPLTSQPYVLVAGTSSGITSVRDLIAAAKRNPGELKFGSAGIGSGTHFGAEKFNLVL